MGFVPDALVTALSRAPAGDPTVYGVDGMEIALRRELQRPSACGKPMPGSKTPPRRLRPHDERLLHGPEFKPPTESAPPGALKTVVLIGPPNSGKSTLFNRLTGLRQKVANFPGVTVEQRMGLMAGAAATI